MLEKFPTLGAVCRIHTSSYRSVRNLSNGLMQIRRFNGGRLARIKAVLKATPERIWYTDKEGFRHSSVAHILSLEIGATDIPGLVASMNELTMLLEQGRGRFGAGGKAQFIVHEEDAERAGEIAAEFYPDVSQPPELAELMVGPTEQDEQCARICDLARKLGYNEALIRMKLGQWADNLAGLESELLNELDDFPEQPGGARRKAETKRRRGAGRAVIPAVGTANTPTPSTPAKSQGPMMASSSET